MNNNKISALLLAMASAASNAGTMGPAAPSYLLLLEAGASYSHSFYQDNAIFPESRTSTTPNGYSINLNDFYPNNFWGGYIGASIYLPSDWLLNARYDMYQEKSQINYRAETEIEIAPSRLSLSVDKLWGDINTLSYGLGAGAVIETLNEGNFWIALNTNNPLSESIQGRSVINPLVEAFTMYRFGNIGIKLNAAYQIPVNNKFGNGDMNVNLGFNYAL